MNSRDGLNETREARKRKQKGRSSVNKSWKKGHQICIVNTKKRQTMFSSQIHLTPHNSSVSSKQGREPSSVTVTVQGNLLPPPLHPSSPGHPRLAQRLLRPTGSTNERSASHHPPSLPTLPSLSAPFPSAPPLKPPSVGSSMPRFPLLPVCVLLPSLPTSLLSARRRRDIPRRREKPFITTTQTITNVYPAQT